MELVEQFILKNLNFYKLKMKQNVIFRSKFIMDTNFNLFSLLSNLTDVRNGCLLFLAFLFTNHN